MNIVLFSDKDRVGTDRIELKGRRFEHLMRVNRIGPGDDLIIGQINGNAGKGRVIEILSDSTVIEVSALDQEPPLPLPLNLVLALPRPKMVKRIIESVTSLGVKNIYLINSWRVEKSFWKSPVLSEKELYRHMILGLEQCRDTMLPTIHKERLFSPFVHKKLPDVDRETIKLIAHPKGGKPLPSNQTGPMTLAIGPEGGFIEREVQTFEDYGYTACHAGPRILRVETAVTALISRLFL